MRKIILIGLICLIGLIWPKKSFAASFSLSPASVAKKVGDVFAVDIVLDAGTDTVSGASAIITYDTAKLQVQDDDSSAAGIQIKQGTIFNQTPLTNLVDATAGKIQYDSGSLGTTFTGQRGVMATIHFKAVAAGTAAVNFVFDTSSTADTSLVAGGSSPTNLLTAVSNGNYTISSTATVASPPVRLPPTGALENTLAALFAGFLFLSAGWYFARR